MKTYLMTCLALVISMSSYGQDTTRIYIENFTQNPVLFELQAIAETIDIPDYKVKKLDTMIIVHQLPLTLITVAFDSNQNYIHNSYIISSGKKVYIKNYSDTITVFEAESDEIRNNELFFFQAMQKELGNFEGFMIDLPFRGEVPTIRLQKIQTVYQKRLKFLETYAQLHTISENFKDMLKAKFYYRQYVDFLQLYQNDKVFKQKTIFSTPIIDFIKQLRISDNYCGVSPYIDAVVAKIIVESPNINDYSAIYAKAKQKLEGLTCEYVLYKIIASAERYPNTNLLIADFFTVTTNDVLKSSLLSKFGESIIIKGLSTKNLAIDKAIVIKLEEQKAVLWSDLISGGKIKYLDFWASWCGACRLEIPNAKKLKADYAMKGIDFVYISMDENGGAWAKASKKEDLPEADSYILPNPKKSVIAKQFKISSIPRYVVIGKGGKVINADAPRPSDPKIRKLFDELLKQ